MKVCGEYTRPILSHKIGKWRTGCFQKNFWKYIYGFIKLILVILISLSNFLFYLFLSITMKKKILSGEIRFCYKWLMMEPKGTYKKDLFFQCLFFLATEPKALKMQSEQQIQTMRAEGNATNSEIMVFNFLYLGKYGFSGDFNMYKWQKPLLLVVFY